MKAKEESPFLAFYNVTGNSSYRKASQSTSGIYEVNQRGPCDQGDSLTKEMVGLHSARTKPQASLTCTKRTKTWRRIQKREGRRSWLSRPAGEGATRTVGEKSRLSLTKNEVSQLSWSIGMSISWARSLEWEGKGAGSIGSILLNNWRSGAHAI